MPLNADIGTTSTRWPMALASSTLAKGRAMAKLTKKQEDFCIAYIELGNATEAYKRAYAAGNMKAEGIRVNAAKLLASTNIALRINEIRAAASEKAAVTLADVLVETGKLAFVDPRKLIREDGTVKALKELDDATAASVSSIEWSKDGTIKYKFWDKNAALDKLMKNLGGYSADNAQKQSPLSELAAQELLAMRERLLNGGA
jgi:phage terminase small subunit